MLKNIRDVRHYKTSDGNQHSIHKAVVLGQINIVKEILTNYGPKYTDLINEKDHKGFTPLHYACISGNFDCIHLLSEHKANITELTRNSSGVVHLAALSGVLEIVKYFVKQKKELKYQLEVYDRKGLLPIHFAARSGNLQVIEYLIKKDPNQFLKTTNHGMNIIHIAAENGFYELTKILLNKWREEHQIIANNNSNLIKFPPDSDGNTLLHFTAFSGNVKLFKYIEEYYTLNNISQTRNAHGHSPIFGASVSCNVEMIKYINNSFNNNSDIFKEHSVSNTIPLFCAVKSGDLSCVSYILEHFKYNNEMDNQGRNIFHYAAMSGSIEVFEYLLDSIDIDKKLFLIPSNQSKQSVLQFSIVDKSKKAKLLKWLLTNNKIKDEMIPLLSHIDKEEFSVLHRACYHGNFSAVKFLLKYLKRNDKDHNLIDIKSDLQRISYLSICATRHHLDILRYLLQIKEVVSVRGIHKLILHRLGYCQYEEIFKDVINYLDIDINEKDIKGQSSLHNCALLGNFSGFRSLCKLNADINNVSIEGITLLHSASYGGNLNIVKDLVNRYNYDVNQVIINGDQSSALHCAAAKLNFDIIEFLVQNNANVNSTNIHNVTILHEACRNDCNISIKKQVCLFICNYYIIITYLQNVIQIF